MSPLAFEQRHAPEWAALEAQLTALERGGDTALGAGAADAARRYRLVCEHLALARSRAYPLHIAERLDLLAQRAHRLIYRQPQSVRDGLVQLVTRVFPAQVRASRRLLAIAALVFVLPMVALYVAVRLDPAMALTVIDVPQLAEFDAMYGDSAEPLGRSRAAETDWEMFGYYIRNNITVAFQCFATGLLAGVGSIAYLAYNGLVIGAVAAYVDSRGLGHNFWPFVATHGAFELTAIVIAGAAGLMLGQALLAPGRRTRVDALRHAGAAAAPLVAGAVVLLVVAAVIEAFWSSARWVPAPLKFGVAALCWAGVLLYLTRSGVDRVDDAH